MNTLYFVKFRHTSHALARQIVFCLTAADEKEAEASGLALIADHCRNQYAMQTVEAICTTPDTVTVFEPC